MTDTVKNNSLDYADRNLQVSEKLWNIEQKLKEIYFFTDQQILDVFRHTTKYDILSKNTEEDVRVFEQVISDAEQKYAKIPMEISINEYLYQNLMSVESFNSEKRKQDIVDNIDTILDGQDTRIITYRDFIPNGTYSDELVVPNLQSYLEQHVNDFFVIHIDEDIAIDEKKKSKIKSKLIQHYLSRTRMMSGINFYVFVQKDGSKRLGIGTQKWTTGEANDYFFGELVKKNNATTVSIPLSSLIVDKK